MTTVVDAYLVAATSAASLLADPAVAERWLSPSALPEYRVSGLAGHLASQVFAVATALEVAGSTTTRPEVVPLEEHYRRARWLGAGVDDDIHVLIRSRGEGIAAPGAEALAEQTAETVDRLRDDLPKQPHDLALAVPGGSWAMYLEHFLTTRLMELTVHSDDLAYSVGIATPELPEEVLERVFALLTRLSVQRHGPTALLRALSRTERAPRSISAL